MTKKLIIALFLLTGLIQFSCKKGNSGPPVITGVRLIDSTLRDSTFNKAAPGTEVVLEGQNLGGAEAIYFNDTSAYFNPVYVTNSNIIVTIPSTAQTAATNPGVPSTIRLVTNHGSTIYSFTLYLPAPVITSISFDNSGTLVYINGTNLVGIKKITFPVSGNDTALSYTINKTYTQIAAAIPPGTPFTDSLRISATWGNASFPYPPPMTITSLSDENAIAGSTLLINGTNLIGVSKITFPGSIDVTSFQSISVNQLSVTVPSGITAPDTLRLTGVLGSAASTQPFDNYLDPVSPGYLSTFEQQWASDNSSFVGWTGGYASASTVAASYPGGTGAAGLLIQAGAMGANAGTGSQGNPGFLQLNDVPWVSNTANSINNYSLKFEVYVASPWSAGEVWIAVGDWYAWSSYTARWAPWSTATNGTYNPSGWTTVTIPLTQLITGNQYWQTVWSTTGSPATTFASYPYTSVCFMVANDQAASVPANSINLAIDNVRIVKGQ